jgi:hypothetical protein
MDKRAGTALAKTERRNISKSFKEIQIMFTEALQPIVFKGAQESLLHMKQSLAAFGKGQLL